MFDGAQGGESPTQVGESDSAQAVAGDDQQRSGGVPDPVADAPAVESTHTADEDGSFADEEPRSAGSAMQRFRRRR